MRRTPIVGLLFALALSAQAQDAWLTYNHPHPRFSVEYPGGWRVASMPAPGNLDLDDLQLIGKADVRFEADVQQGRLQVTVQLYEMTGDMAADRLAEILSARAGDIRVGRIRGRTFGRFEIVADTSNSVATVVVDPDDPPYAAVVSLYAPAELFQACLPGYERICGSLTFPSEVEDEPPVPELKFGEPRLVRTPHPVSWAEWSPGGARIACVCRPGRESQVWVLPTQTDVLLRVGAGLASAAEPVWSPGGGAIALAGRPGNGDGAVNIYTTDLDGQAQEQLTDTPTDAQGELVPDARNHLPRWSPDGRWMLYNSIVRDMTRTAVVPGERDAGAEERVLLPSSDAAWAPDSRRIVCSVGGVVWVMDALGGPSAPITGPVGGRDPAWSPDGRRIAFVSRQPGAGGAQEDAYLLTVTYPDGSEPRTLVTVPAPIDAPVWSPDSSHLAFTNLRDGNVYAIGVDGRELAPVAPSLPRSRRPRWSPDGASILLIADVEGEDRLGELYCVPVTRGE